ncbi:DUF4389 domain-containing protein [Nocardioides luteus]|uniref:DUF4389 domain-containing protein n=1 Tax=Nocardioides luteus TaxID=1844 RepID=UPI0018CAB5BB|nr:DUF4389 domain-containing protein [Nocardioides luteus]MBG6096971.1 hypothetical protein [Nocardioides luteus]
MNSTESPVVLEGQLDTRVSRALWLVKWLLLIPHYIILLFLWVAFTVLSVVAWFAILFTGRYPRAIFDFNLGVLRWTWRVDFYGYAALGTDAYPPFTLDDVADYPARLHIAYPERLSRGLVLVKSWLLAIPHLLVLGFFVGGGLYVTQASNDPDTWTWGSGIVGLLVLFAGVAMLFGRGYPRGIFDLVLGMDRWAARVAAYVFLMTDTYPPFRLDQGGSDPTRPVAPEPSAPAGAAATPPVPADPVGTGQP